MTPDELRAQIETAVLCDPALQKMRLRVQMTRMDAGLHANLLRLTLVNAVALGMRMRLKDELERTKP